MSVNTAVIPAAGFGTRMLPAAKAIPKELLPIIDRPTIQYVVEEARDAGITDVVLVTSREKAAIEAHFRPYALLEDRLKQSGKQALLEKLNQLIAQVRFHCVDQPEQRGLGDAVLRAKDRVGNQAFTCLLGDTIFSGGKMTPAAQLAEAHKRLGTSIIGLEDVPAEKVDRYGIVSGSAVSDGAYRIDSLVEKPSIRNAPSRLAIAARYLLTPAIFKCLEETKPGKGGEVQLTDAINLLAQREAVHGVVLSARRHDIGNPVDWMKTNLLFAMRDPALWKQLSPLLDEAARR